MSDEKPTTAEELRKLDNLSLAQKEEAFFKYQRQVQKSDRLQRAADRLAKEQAMTPEDRAAYIRAGRPAEGEISSAHLSGLSASELEKSEKTFLKGLRK
jgi:hypothetical protein